MDEEFDGLQYIASYGDLIQAFGANAAAGEHHYERSAAPSGARPTPSTRRSTSPTTPTCSGVRDDGALATVHDIHFGFGEGRNDALPPPDGFDPLQYIASHADLIDAFGAKARSGRAPLPALRPGRGPGHLHLR